MQRTLISHACLVVVLCLVAGGAVASECKPVHVRVGPATYLDPCVYQEIAFAYCIDTPLRGTFRGTWHYYGELDNGVYWPPLDDDDLPLFDPDPYSAFVAGWGLGAIVTNKGDVYIQDNYLWNLYAISDDHVPFVSVMSIEGGSGKYEGASGWLGVIADDSGDWSGYMKGVICTP